MTVAEMLQRQQHTIPVKPENRVIEVTRMEDGSMHLKFANGTTGVLGPEDMMMQIFVIRTMIGT